MRPPTSSPVRRSPRFTLARSGLKLRPAATPLAMPMAKLPTTRSTSTPPTRRPHEPSQSDRPGPIARRLLRLARLRPVVHVRGDAHHQPGPRQPDGGGGLPAVGAGRTDGLAPAAGPAGRGACHGTAGLAAAQAGAGAQLAPGRAGAAAGHVRPGQRDRQRAVPALWRRHAVAGHVHRHAGVRQLGAARRPVCGAAAYHGAGAGHRAAGRPARDAGAHGAGAADPRRVGRCRHRAPGGRAHRHGVRGGLGHHHGHRHAGGRRRVAVGHLAGRRGAGRGAEPGGAGASPGVSDRRARHLFGHPAGPALRERRTAQVLSPPPQGCAMTVPTITIVPNAPTGQPTWAIERWTRSSIAFASATVLLLAVLCLGPLWLQAGTVDRLTTLFIYVILAVMWNALAGYAGLVSIGHQALFGLGAYAVVRLADAGLGPSPALLVGAVLVALAAVPLAAFMLRLQGGEFAIGMWVVAALAHLCVNLDSLVQGETGTSMIALQQYAADDRRAYTYWAALAAMAGLCWVVFLLLRSKVGTAAQAIRQRGGSHLARRARGRHQAAGVRAVGVWLRPGRRPVARHVHQLSAQDLFQRAVDGLPDLHGAGGGDRHHGRPHPRRAAFLCGRDRVGRAGRALPHRPGRHCHAVCAVFAQGHMGGGTAALGCAFAVGGVPGALAGAAQGRCRTGHGGGGHERGAPIGATSPGRCRAQFSSSNPAASASNTTRIRREVRSSRWDTSQMGKRTGGRSSSTRTMPGVLRAISVIMAPMPMPWHTSAQWATVWSE